MKTPDVPVGAECGSRRGPKLMNQGHVFVVLGRIGSLAADACIIPTDRDFTVEAYWNHVIDPDRFDPEAHRPAGWSKKGWGRSSYRDDIWFLDVYDDSAEGPDSFERLRRLLQDIARRRLVSSSKGRPLPLVLVPLIGTRGGGKNHQRGAVVSRLLETCNDFVARHPIDVAVVTPNRSAFSALQHRRTRQSEQSFPGINREKARHIGGLAADNSLALFIGAGTSVPAGLPSWEQLLDKLAARAALSEPVRASFDTLTSLDQAELLHIQLGDTLQQAVVDALDTGAHSRPALAHALLASLGAENAVTTNYDQFL